MRFFGLKSCDTCRKARKALEEAGYRLEIIDVRQDGLAGEDLDSIVASYGDRAINRASATWRGLSDTERAADARTLLQSHPLLLKRPAIMHQNAITIGWGADVQDAYLGDPT